MPWQPDVRFKLRWKSASLAFWASLETTSGLLLVIDDFFNATMSTNTRKNNGDRATSPEVVPTLAKKPSMADGDKEEVFEDCLEEEDPILLELKEMLTNIQTSILSILKENAKLNKDKAEPKSSLKSNERELKELKASLALANTQN